MPTQKANTGDSALIHSKNGSCVDDLKKPAVIFAPHPDDETLGCGGTIVRKLAQGARVDVVFFTDGARSHTLMPSEELAKIRREEALKACGVLGLEGRRLHFFDLQDGLLAEQDEKALALTIEFLRGIEVQEAFVTYRHEPSPDHAAANNIVRKAIDEMGRPMSVWEYPIWYWDRWPWVRMEKGYWRHPWGMTKAIAHGLPDKILPTRFNCVVDISKQLDVKRSALAQHRTQVTRYNGDPDWKTLGDLAGGRFLDMLLQPQEVFFKYEVRASKAI